MILKLICSDAYVVYVWKFKNLQKKYENKRKCIQLLALKITEPAKNHVVMKRILF